MWKPFRRPNDFFRALARIPAPGTGQCHRSLLGAANAGVRGGYDDNFIFEQIRAHIPPGDRPVPDREIAAAVQRARHDHGIYPYRAAVVIPVVNEPVLDGDAARKWLIEQGNGATADRITACSPIPIPARGQDQARLLLKTLYAPQDIVCSGALRETGVVAVEFLLVDLANGAPVGPFITPNTLTGRLGYTKDGRLSRRADSCVAVHRLCLVEFDNLSLKDQFAFWAAVDLPIAALIYSGGKSIHGWIRMDCADEEDWERRVRHELYRRFLVPMGADRSNANPSRFSRMPGWRREETGAVQQLLYLAPEGRRVQP